MREVRRRRDTSKGTALDTRVLSTLLLALALLPSWTAAGALPRPSPGAAREEALSISGTVRDEAGPVAGAIVRRQATSTHTSTGDDGSFRLDVMAATGPVILTAWAEGYYVGWTEATPGEDAAAITLTRHYRHDNQDYDWFSTEAANGSRSCGHCMPAVYEEWQRDAHSHSAVNPRFLTMYNGTDIHGSRSPETRYASASAYGRLPLRPDPAKPYYGPGYKLDYPTTAGNCAACHAPAAAARRGRYYAADMNDLSGIDGEGVFCEFCHKIGEVILEPATGLPRENMPGVLSLRLYRPGRDEQLFFGPYDDVTRRVSYLPLQKESALCAPCHHGVFWDVVIYNSYGEWLESSYSDPVTGQTCQDCHMPATKATRFVLAEKGGLERPPGSILSHYMPGASDERLLQNAVTLDVSANREDERIDVTVTITNDRTGHHVPTDSPLRHLILLVQAAGEDGRELAQLEGPTVPEWCGVGDRSRGYYAGLPGKAYAKVLQEWWTEISPTGAYWKPVRILSDNRLAAHATDTSVYAFGAPDGGKVTVEVSLLFRRAFIELMDQKGWEAPDIVMARRSVTMGAGTTRGER
jgi:hypothetical protein